jgi:hypothetical protein
LWADSTTQALERARAWPSPTEVRYGSGPEEEGARNKDDGSESEGSSRRKRKKVRGKEEGRRRRRKGQRRKEDRKEGLVPQTRLPSVFCLYSIKKR